MKIENLRTLCIEDKIKWSLHAMKRLRERKISIDDFINVIKAGEIIEPYPDDYPHPSCLIFGYSKANQPLHVVIGCDKTYIYAITAYYPNPKEWELDLRTRIRKET
ncbi:MAG: DUF4258 domain-containing protein [Firmicutes bacterium]|nr:DUF4258 domain-containing protein [Bacillota bacterium]